MARQHIHLPAEIPDYLFDHLGAEPVHDGIKRNLRQAYARVQKDSYSDAPTPRAALAKLFSRSLDPTNVNTRSLIKMFGRVAPEYVNAVPYPIIRVNPTLPTEPQRTPTEAPRTPEESQLALF